MEAVAENPVIPGQAPPEQRPALTLPTVHTVMPGISDQEEFARVAEQAFQKDDNEPDTAIQSLSNRLLAEFKQAEQDRLPTELRWLENLRQYRGKYDADTEKRLGIRSKAFVRKTRVKVKTVDSRVLDLLFPAGSEKNWTCDPTPKATPDPAVRAAIIQEMTQAAAKQKAAQQQPGQPPAAPMVPPDDVVDAAVQEIAKAAAKAMSLVIEDQLAETNYRKISGQAAHSCHLYGTGIVKGPLVERKIRTRYVQQGKNWVAKSETYTVPFLDYVPLWRWYPDMQGGTELSQLRFVYERHLMAKHELLALATRKTFNRKVIIEFVKSRPRGEVMPRHFEPELKSLGDRESTQTKDNGQYEVLERWGYIDGEDLRDAGCQIAEDRLHESFFANIWMLSNGEIIKAVLQPLNGVTWPYHLYHFDKDETSIFGEGLASIMKDDQEMLNASVRMMLDNGALTSGPMLEVFLHLLATTDNAAEIGPWKTYFRNAQNPEQSAVRPIEIPNNIEWLQKMAEMFEQNSDETTAIPRYMSGENATQGAAGTSSGLSMLMAAANIVIKDLISAWDEGITRPFLTALYRWNMQFHKDLSIKGDFDVKARGTASLVAKEVRARSLAEFAQSTDNPNDAPYIKRQRLLQQRAEAMELSDVVKTEDEFKAEQEGDDAKRMKKLQEDMQAAQLAEAQAKVGKLLAEAETIKKRAEEMVANIEKTAAATIATKVETIYAALQAGGVATTNPTTAPAGDEILRSAGYVDVTPNPSIAQLDGQPVQADDGVMRVMNKGQTFAQEPRGPGAGQEQEAADGGAQPGTNEVPQPGSMKPESGVPADLPTQTAGHAPPSAFVGERKGIETARND